MAVGVINSSQNILCTRLSQTFNVMNTAQEKLTPSFLILADGKKE